MKFTSEQQEHIEKLIAEKTQGLFTEEELNRRVTSEVDRRVESGIQKGLETQRTKWENEFKTKAQLSAEELAKAELDEKFNELSLKEKEIFRKSNTIDAKDMLTEAQIPKTHYEKFMGLLISDDTDATIENVTNFIDTFNSTRNEIESSLRKEMSNIPPPENNPSGDKTVGKEDFDKMSYGEKIEFKSSNPELFDKFMK